MKRYKVIINTSVGVKTATFEAENQKDAEEKAIKSLESWQKPATAEAEEVGMGLRRTMP